MIRLIAAELLKIRTTRTAWVFFVAALAINLLVLVPTLALADLFDPEDSASLFAGGGTWGTFVLILGIVGATGEHRHGTITPTYLVTPRRELVVAAKAVAYALVGAGMTLVIAGTTALIALPWLAAKGGAQPSAGDLVLLITGGAIYGALAGALGVGIGAALRNQVAGVLIAIVELLMLEPVIAVLRPQVAPYLPSFAAGGLLSGGEAGELPMWASGLLYLGYATILVAVGMLLERRRDIA